MEQVLSSKEIKKRALAFARDFSDASSEKGESQTFWNEFFNVFGKNRRKLAEFELPVSLKNTKNGRIDLIWKGILIVEQKSAGKDLDKAVDQALDYINGLEPSSIPRFILVSDFKKFKLYDLEKNSENEFVLSDLHQNIHLFGFISGHTIQTYESQFPANKKAAELMGKLHDAISETGYCGHPLDVFLVRLLFCLFADDSGIWDRDHFHSYIDRKTKKDGSDLSLILTKIFEILNKPKTERYLGEDEDLTSFEYIDGKLFEERLELPPSFTTRIRDLLLECCSFDWSKISPAIFGTMFQASIIPEKRKELQAHYTSEENVLKVINGLFLDDLLNDYDESKTSIRKLEKLLEKISIYSFLDPACGSGDFLIVSYMELRKLELEILKKIDQVRANKLLELDIENMRKVKLDQFYGIDLDELSVQITMVALWLVDHQMNMLLSEAFGEYYPKFPLKSLPNIYLQNSLRMNWDSFFAKQNFDFILGNPPFISKKNRNCQQKEDMKIVFKGKKGYDALDYVCLWYIKTAEFMQIHEKTKAAFVSTNSIVEGEQVSLLWDYLFQSGISIYFAHRYFRWNNQAKKVAQVFVVIIGFSRIPTNERYIYDYDTPVSQPVKMKANNINAYLLDAPDIIVKKRNIPICDSPTISFGNMPNDDGNLLLNEEEKDRLLNAHPELQKYVKRFISAHEYMQGMNRWCLWFYDQYQYSELKSINEVMSRIERVREYRSKSKRIPTKKLAAYPYLFGEIRQPKEDFIIIPRTTSGLRQYIPLDIINKDNIISDTCIAVLSDSFYDYGVLSSTMHMCWINVVCGKLKGDFRYSIDIGYNNFPWPEKEINKERIELEANKIIELRRRYHNETLSDLYSVNGMPQELRRAHERLDREVDRAYKIKAEARRTENSRIIFLLSKYASIYKPLLRSKKPRKQI